FCSACANQKPPTITAASAQTITRPTGVLRVCADPNNLPFSNNRLEGFENKLAELLAHDLGERVEYTWWAQRRGFFRNTLKAGMCDVVMGVPSGFEMALTTRPYYRSSYVFLSRKDRHLNLSSFDDPLLRKLRIGVQIIGDDQSNAPPAHALTRRNIIDTVEKGDIDLAIVWGPLAGYFAKQSHAPMQVVPVTPQIDQPFLPFVFDISMGVRRGDQQLKDQLEQLLEQRRADIDRILEDYRVPRVEGGQGV